MYRLGIDVDSETTTGLVMDGLGKIVCCAREQTTADLLGGMEQVLQKIGKRQKGVCRSIRQVIIGTDYFANALLEGKNLSKVCSIRIGQTPNSIPPLYGGDEALLLAIRPLALHVAGGHELDGSVGKKDPSRQELEDRLLSIREQGFQAFAITGAFSPVNQEHENQVALWVRELWGDDCSITTSHELGSIGFLERENSAILNAALSKLITHSLTGLESLMRRHHIEASIYFTQNDGSLLSYESALLHPIRTFGSRISNSFRGAALLTELQECVIVDVSQYRVSIGALEGGFPREKRRNPTIAGVHVNLRMPDITTLSLEATSSVRDDLLDAVYQAIQRFQPRFEPLPIVFVGEGSERIASAFNYPWADVHLPGHYQNASALGACMAPVSGSVDRIYWLEERSREETIGLAKKEAVQAAVRAGAALDSVVVQKLETIPLSYMPTKALRVKVKAVGTLNFFEQTH